MISNSSYTRMDTMSMIGVAKGNAEALANAKAAAEDAKAKYGREVKVVEYEMTKLDSPMVIDWTASDTLPDDGTYAPETPAAAEFYGVEEQAGTTDAEAMFAEFKAWADMSPAERIRAQYLEDHDLTEDALKAMSEEERAPILAAIKEAIERQLGTSDAATQEAATSPEADIMAMLQG